MVCRAKLPPGLETAAVEELGNAGRNHLRPLSVCVEPRLVHGNPATEILAESEHHRASLIVMGSSARSGFQNVPRDRTVYKVLAHAHCPVLTLREEQVAIKDDEASALAVCS